jgi:hypothetical protein
MDRVLEMAKALWYHLQISSHELWYTGCIASSRTYGTLGDEEIA